MNCNSAYYHSLLVTHPCIQKNWNIICMDCWKFYLPLSQIELAKDCVAIGVVMALGIMLNMWVYNGLLAILCNPSCTRSAPWETTNISMPCAVRSCIGSSNSLKLPLVSSPSVITTRTWSEERYGDKSYMLRISYQQDSLSVAYYQRVRKSQRASPPVAPSALSAPFWWRNQEWQHGSQSRQFYYANLTTLGLKLLTMVL